MIGIAAEDANAGAARSLDVFDALRDLDPHRDPVTAIEEEMTQNSRGDSEHHPLQDIELLCGIGFRIFDSPKLYPLSKENRFEVTRFPCCIESGNGAAQSLLKQLKVHLLDLRDAQAAVCAGVWLAKQTDELCGGGCDICFLTPGSKLEKIPKEQI